MLAPPSAQPYADMKLFLALAFVAAAPSQSLAPSIRRLSLASPRLSARGLVLLRSSDESSDEGLGVSNFDGGGVPSDSSTDDAELAAAAAAGETLPPIAFGPSAPAPEEIPPLKSKLLALAAATARGEAASDSEKDQVRELVGTLESAMDQESAVYDQMLGTWELVFSDTQLFRSSPFFMVRLLVEFC